MATRLALGASHWQVQRELWIENIALAIAVALTVLPLAGAGLFIRTLIHLETLPAGFSPTGVLTGKASLDSRQYQNPSAFRRLLDESLASMREIRGVQNAAVGLTLPYERVLINGVSLADGKNAGQTVSTDEVYITPSYFETLQIAVLAGRGFADSHGPEAQRVVVVNQAFARKFFYCLNWFSSPESRRCQRSLPPMTAASTNSSSHFQGARNAPASSGTIGIIQLPIITRLRFLQIDLRCPDAERLDGNTRSSCLASHLFRRISKARPLIGTSRRPSAVLLSGTKITPFC